jgi:hypothetical protein
MARAGKIDQNLPHELSRNGEKMCPILLTGPIGSETQVDLVDQGCGLKRMARLFTGHVAVSETVQFSID